MCLDNISNLSQLKSLFIPLKISFLGIELRQLLCFSKLKRQFHRLLASVVAGSCQTAIPLKVICLFASSFFSPFSSLFHSYVLGGIIFKSCWDLLSILKSVEFFNHSGKSLVLLQIVLLPNTSPLLELQTHTHSIHHGSLIFHIFFSL